MCLGVAKKQLSDYSCADIDELVCVYNIGLFDFKKDRGHGEFVTTCMFVGGSLRSVGSVQIGFVPEDSLWENEEIDV